MTLYVQLRPIEDVLKELRLRDFGMEIGVISFLALYIVTMFVGSRKNKRLAERWCSMYGIGNGILAQQFAYVGVGEHHARFPGSADADRAAVHRLDVQPTGCGQDVQTGTPVTLKLPPYSSMLVRIWASASHD